MATTVHHDEEKSYSQQPAAAATALPLDNTTAHHDPESGASSLSLDKDEAIGLVGEHAREIDPAVEARVLKKIDWFLIPAMIVGMYLHTNRPKLQPQPSNT